MVKRYDVEPVSTTEFHAAIGEIRRRGDERHQENVERLKALEKEFRDHTFQDLTEMRAVKDEITKNTGLTEATLKTVTGIDHFLIAATFGRKLILGAAALAVAAAALWASFVYFFQGGPPPSGPHL